MGAGQMAVASLDLVGESGDADEGERCVVRAVGFVRRCVQ